MTTTDDAATRRRTILGWGWRVEPISPHVDLGCDLVLESYGAGARLAEVTSVDNIVQTLRVALTTPLGENIFNTAFGFDGLNAISKETDTVMQRERIRLSIVRLLQREPRVARITAIDVAFGDAETRALIVTVQIVLADGQPATLSLSPLSGAYVGS